uniref:Uncharacterized protein n=1 Tax=Zooxanthella nutricula TaxID=1333877 RepID=A0A7S2MT48_9DINO
MKLSPYSTSGHPEFKFRATPPNFSQQDYSIRSNFLFPSPKIEGTKVTTFHAKLDGNFLGFSGEVEGYGKNGKKFRIYGSMLSQQSPHHELYSSAVVPPVPSLPLTYAAQVPVWATRFVQDAAKAGSQVGDPPMSAELMYTLPVPDENNLTSACMSDLMAAAWSVFPDDQAKTLKLTDEKAKWTCPAYLSDYVNSNQDIKDVLCEMITVQTCQGMYADHTQAQWRPDFTSKREVQQRVQYYLQGGDKTCMSNKPAFGNVYNYIYNYQYGQFTRGLQPYMEGKGGRTRMQWAQALFDFATSGDRLCDACMEDASSGLVKKVGHILSCLTDAYFPPKGQLKGDDKRRKKTLAELYTQKIAVKVKEFARIYATTLEVDEMKDVMTKLLQKLWDYSQGMPGETAKEISNAYAEMQIRRAGGITQEIQGLIEELATAWKASAEDEGGSWDHVQSWIDGHPNWSANLKSFWTFVGGCCSVLIATVGTIYLFENWKTVDPEWKVFFVSASFYHTLKAAKMFGEATRRWWDKPMELIENGSFDEALSAVDTEWYAFVGKTRDSELFRSCSEVVGEETTEELFTRVAFTGRQRDHEMCVEFMAEEGSAHMAQNVAKTGRFSKYFAKFAFMVKCLGAVVVLICVIAMVVQIAREWDTEDKGLIALDILATVAGVIEFAAITANIVGCTVTLLGVANVIPIIGQIAALVGIVIFVIAAAIRGSKLDPVQEWVKDHGRPALAAVKKPSKDWLDKHPIQYDAAPVFGCFVSVDGKTHALEEEGPGQRFGSPSTELSDDRPAPRKACCGAGGGWWPASC